MVQINWKVAIIGIVVLIIFGALGVLAYSHSHKDPQELIAKAEELLDEANTEAAELIASGSYSEDDIDRLKSLYIEAQNNYGGAFNATKDDKLKIELLFTLVEYHKIDNPFHSIDWKKVAGCWNKVLTINPKNIKANKSLLDYMLVTANSLEKITTAPNTSLWNRINEYATDYIQAAEANSQKPEMYVLVTKAKSMLKIVEAGQTTNEELSTNEVITELQKLSELYPSNVDIYQYMAQAAWIKAGIDERKGILDARKTVIQTQYDILQNAIDANPGELKAYTNLLNAKLLHSRADAEANKQLEADFVALTKQFSENPEAYRTLAAYYSLNPKDLDKCIANINKAIELDNNNVRYAVSLSTAYLRKGMVSADTEAFGKAFQITADALNLPDAADVTGPREGSNRLNKFELLGLKGMSLFELAFASEDAAKQQWAEKLTETTYQIQQFYGTEEHPSVMKWLGLTEIAKGNENEGISLLYNAYRQFRVTASVTEEGKHLSKELRYLPYTLARLYDNKSDIGLRRQFIEDALANNISYFAPSVLLDYAELIMKAKQHSNVIIILDGYNQTFGENLRSNQLLTDVSIKLKDFDKAEKLILAMDPDSPETMAIHLRLMAAKIYSMSVSLAQTKPDNTSGSSTEPYTEEQLAEEQAKRVTLYKKLLKSNPDKTPRPNEIARYYLNNDQLDNAKALVDEYLAYRKPVDGSYDFDYVQAKTFRNFLSEPDHTKVPNERALEIAAEIISEIPNAKQRNILLGQQYESAGENEKSNEYFKKAYEIAPEDKSVISLLFESSLKNNDLDNAKKLIQIAITENVDGCEGILFKSRLDMINKNYQDAIIKLDECIDMRPVKTVLYALRSQCHSNTGNHEKAIEDIKTTLKMNFLDPTFAIQYVTIVAARNTSFGSNVTFEQRLELENALRNAIALNPEKWRLRGMFAEHLIDSNPLKALAIRQQLARNINDITTNMMLGNMALRMSKKEMPPEKRKVFLEIAEKGFADAYAIDPANQELLGAYSEYYRMTGQPEKAESLFAGSKSLMWQFHLRDGQYDKAREILLKEHTSNTEDETAILGLMTVSQKTGKTEDLIKYSNELLKINNTSEAMLRVTQTYLDTGLVTEAEEMLEILTENHPDESRTELLKAWLTLSKGQPKDALSIIDAYIKDESQNAMAWYIKGQINRLMGNLNEAISDFQKSKQIAPPNDIQIELARTYAQKGDTTIAIGTLKDAIKAGQTPIQARVMLESLYIQKNRTVDLAKFYEETISKYPDNYGWHLKAGQFALKNKQYKIAETSLLKSWQLSQKEGGNINALSSYLQALTTNKKYEEANKFASKYIDSDFAPVAYTYLALVQIRIENDSKAIDYYHKALEKAGANDNLLTNILNHMLVNAGPKSVVDWCGTTLAANPNSIPANMAMYNLSQKNGDYDIAAKYIDKCISVIGEESPLWGNYSLSKALLMTNAYIKTTERKYLLDAIKIYEDILTVAPNNYDILNNLAYLLAENDERLSDAVEFARKAHEASPNNPSRLDTYAYTLAENGNYEKAKELLLSAIVLYERSGQNVIWDVYEHLAIAQEGLGKKIEAAESYRRALDIAGDNISTKKREQILSSIEKLTK